MSAETSPQPLAIVGDPLSVSIRGSFDVWGKYSSRDLWELLPHLVEFVERLTATYSLSDSVLLPCWPLHSSVLVELAGLREYREYLYPAGAAASGDAAIMWHRELSMAMTRLRRWTADSGCNSREHNPQRTPSWLLSEGPVREHYLSLNLPNSARGAV